MSAPLAGPEVATPVRSFHRELVAWLRLDPAFMALVPGGVYERPLTPDDMRQFPLVYPTPEGHPDGPRGTTFVTCLVVLPQPRVAAPRGEGVGAVDLYTRLEVRGPRNDAGRTRIAAVMDALDRLEGLRLPIGPAGEYTAALRTLGQPSHPPVDDDANSRALFAFQDCRARVALRST